MTSQPTFPAMPTARDEQIALWQVIERRRLEEAELGRAGLISELADLRARMRWLESCVLGLEENAGGPQRRNQPFAISRSGRVMANAYFPPASGFYPLETERSGRHFRWTGPFRDFVFDLALESAASWNGTLHVLGAMNSDQVNGMMLYADADMVPLQITADDDGYHLSFILPPQQGDSAVRLTFSLPGVLRPCDVEQSEDERALGVRFHALEMASA